MMCAVTYRSLVRIARDGTSRDVDVRVLRILECCNSVGIDHVNYSCPYDEICGWRIRQRKCGDECNGGCVLLLVSIPSRRFALVVRRPVWIDIHLHGCCLGWLHCSQHGRCTCLCVGSHATIFLETSPSVLFVLRHRNARSDSRSRCRMDTSQESGATSLFACLSRLQVLEVTMIVKRKMKLSKRDYIRLLVKLTVAGLAVLTFLVLFVVPSGYFGPISSRVRGLFLKHTERVILLWTLWLSINPQVIVRTISIFNVSVTSHRSVS